MKVKITSTQVVDPDAYTDCLEALATNLSLDSASSILESQCRLDKAILTLKGAAAIIHEYRRREKNMEAYNYTMYYNYPSKTLFNKVEARHPESTILKGASNPDRWRIDAAVSLLHCDNLWALSRGEDIQ